MEQLRPQAIITEATEAGAYNLSSATREAIAKRSPHTATKSSAPSLQLEKALAQQGRQRNQTERKKGEKII